MTTGRASENSFSSSNFAENFFLISFATFFPSPSLEHRKTRPVRTEFDLQLGGLCRLLPRFAAKLFFSHFRSLSDDADERSPILRRTQEPESGCFVSSLTLVQATAEPGLLTTKLNSPPKTKKSFWRSFKLPPRRRLPREMKNAFAIKVPLFIFITSKLAGW